jgi:hypothetical protein
MTSDAAGATPPQPAPAAAPYEPIRALLRAGKNDEAGALTLALKWYRSIAKRRGVRHIFAQSKPADCAVRHRAASREVFGRDEASGSV